MAARLEIVQGAAEVLHHFEEMAAGLADGERMLRGAVANLYVEISERIQQRGEATDGSKIGGGVYSASGARNRRKHGRQTDFIDLTYTGDMLDRSFTYGPMPQGGYGLYFLNQLGADRMALQEQRYAQEIISPSAQELQNANIEILDAIREQVRSPR